MQIVSDWPPTYATWSHHEMRNVAAVLLLLSTQVCHAETQIVRDIEYAGAIFFLGEAVIQDMNNSGTGKMIEVDFEFDNLVSAKLHLNYSDGETMTVTTLPVWSGGT